MHWRGAAALLVVLAAVCVAEEEQEARPVRAEVISCSGWRLNRLPEVKAFIFEDVRLYHNVEFVKSPGAPPTLALYDASDKEYLRLPLSDSNREACNQELLSRGFFKRAHKDDPVPEEYAEGTKRMEL